MSSDNELDNFHQSIAYSEGHSSEDLGETEIKLRDEIEDIRDMLPPPIPLISKTFHPSEPVFQSQDIPFLLLDAFNSKEEVSECGPPVNRSAFPARFSADTSFRSLFPQASLVYLRTNGLVKEGFNLNTCNLRKIIARRRLREKSEERIVENPLLLEELRPFYTVETGEKTLVFESRFESGNLAMAAKVSDAEYNLLLQTDINSRGHTQWFFFSVRNTTANMQVRFNLLNFPKSDSLFNHGMKVLMYSVKRAKMMNSGWFRGGEDIMYYPNGIIKEHSPTGKCYCTLAFTHIFEFTNDTVFFAYSLPFFYSQLQKLLDYYETTPERSQFIHRKTLCRSLGGNNCDMLTITNKGTLEEIRAKRAVIISARVHPGETVGSWMMLGVLDFLTSNDPEADALRQKYLFKVVPMLNPDGVINGNYRCSLIGADMNRRWKNPQAGIHPVIHSFKRVIKNTAGNYEIDLICDLHGHSRKKNIFMYGCNFKRSPQTCKLFPYILSKISPVFSYSYSRFGVQKSKESTLRVSLFKELKIPNIFTLEASFCGADMGKYKSIHFTGDILQEMGKDLCRALLVLNQNTSLVRNPTQPKPLLKNSKKPVKKTEPQPNLPITKAYNIDSILKEMLEQDEILHNGEANISSSGSDSEPSEDNLDEEELKKLIPLSVPSKKKQEKPKKKPVQIKNVYLPKQKPAQKKKCPKCGEEEVAGHVCKVVEAAPPPPKRKIVGLRTYYNLAGKRVHDQATQTPPGLYPKLFTRRHGSTLAPQTPDSVADLSANVSGNEEGFLSDTQSIKLPNFRIHRKETNSNSSGFLDIPRKTPHTLGTFK
jgi:ribosomal protein L32